VVEGRVSEGEVAERLRSSGYVFAPSRAGKHYWEQPGTRRLLPEAHAFTLVREEERQLLSEAGWVPVEIEGDAYWRKPDSGRLYPQGPAVDVQRAQKEREA
jgi:hypothetical protein